MALEHKHHCYMACIFLFCGSFLFLMRLFYKSDYCQEVYNSNPTVIIKSFSKPSGTYSYNFANKVILFASLVLMTLGLIPWYIYKTVPTYRNYFVPPGHPESLASIRIKIDKRMIIVEVCNSLIYFLLFILVVVFLSFGLHKPQNILPADFTHYYFHQDNQIMCISGFGVYIWLKPLLLLILATSFTMAIISLCNIYTEYMKLMRHKGVISNTDDLFFDMVELQMIDEDGEPESDS